MNMISRYDNVDEKFSCLIYYLRAESKLCSIIFCVYHDMWGFHVIAYIMSKWPFEPSKYPSRIKSGYKLFQTAWIPQGDVTWAIWRLGLLETILFVQQLVESDIKEYDKAPHNWSFSSQRASNAESFSIHNVSCIYCYQWTVIWGQYQKHYITAMPFSLDKWVSTIPCMAILAHWVRN